MCKTDINTVTMVNINPDALLERQLVGDSASQNPQIVSCDSFQISKNKIKKYVSL